MPMGYVRSSFPEDVIINLSRSAQHLCSPCNFSISSCMLLAFSWVYKVVSCPLRFAADCSIMSLTFSTEQDNSVAECSRKRGDSEGGLQSDKAMVDSA